MGAHLASEFASTPAGYLNSGLGVLILSGLAEGYRRITNRLNTQDKAGAANTLALSVLVTKYDETARIAAETASAQRKQEIATAVLVERMDRHDLWSAELARQARTDIDGLRNR